MPITIDENGNATADGHSWVVDGNYVERDGELYHEPLLCVIQGDRVLERVLKSEKVVLPPRLS